MIQSEVVIEPISHKYYDTSGREYASVSRVLKEYDNGPDWNAIAKKVAGKGKFRDYPTQADVLALWKANANEAMDYGTGWHHAIEKYQKEFVVLPKDKDKEETIKSITSMYKDYYRVESEAALYHPKYGIAGTSDKVLFPKKNGGTFCIADYKTALKTGGIDYFHKDDIYMKAPVSHLQSSKYSKYNLQLSIYAFMMEELTGMKCRSMWVTFIQEGFPVQYIPMAYLKNEAEAILKDYYLKNNQIIEAVVVDSLDAPEFITE